MRWLAVLTALGFSSFSLTLASLPSWAVRGGASSASAGLVTTVMLGCTIGAQTLVPLLQRRLGTSMLLALGLIALGAPAPLYLVSQQLGWLVATSAVRGVGFGILTVIGALLATSLAPPSRRGEAIGIYGLGIAVPNLAAVPLGTALLSAGHFGVVAILAACPVLAVPLCRHFAGTMPAPPSQHAAADASAGVGAALRSAALPSFVLLLVTLSGGGLLTFLPIARPHGPVATIALLLMGVSGGVSRWGAGSMHDRTGSRALMPVTLVAAALGMALAGVALLGSDHGGPGRVTLLLVGATIFGVGYGGMQNLSQILAFDRAGPEHAVTASTVWNIAFDAGTGIGAYVVGLIAATRLELSGTYLLCATILALALPAATAATRRL